MKKQTKQTHKTAGLQSVVITDAQMKKLDDSLKIGTTWNPAPGEKIYGKILGFKIHKGKFGSKVTETRFIELVQDGGAIVVVWLKTVLENRFAELKIVAGDIIGIEYVGEIKKGKGKSYHSYHVAKL